MLAALLGGVLCVLALVGLGGGCDPAAGLGWVLTSAVYAGGPAAIYLFAAIGYGLLLGRFLPQAPGGGALRASIGLAFMLSVSHGLAALGWLTAMSGIAVCALGLAVMAREVIGSARSWLVARPHVRPGWAAIPAVCVLLTAASNPPGTLWGSEFGGYDALSYHLQLPQEWLTLGRLEPLEHNVYSFLPGYVESAFLHLAVITKAPVASDPGLVHGLMAGDGWRVLSCQWLHAGISLLAAWIIGSLARVLGERAGLADPRQRLAGSIAAGVTLATPWVVVVGSLAYNEMAVLALGAASVLAALYQPLRPWVRGLLTGALVGVACGAKPTALFMVGPVAGLALLAGLPVRGWLPAIGAGTLAGFAALAPWLVRNFVASGNPVFPAASDLFGHAHWTSEQVRRFASGHRFDGSWFDRLRTAVWTSPESSPGAPDVVRFRGLSNPQWGVLFPAGLIAAIMCMAPARAEPSRRARRLIASVLIAGLLAQLLAWFMFTHVQSRFLLPCLITAAPLVGLGIARLARPRAATLLGLALVVVQVGVTVWIWSRQLDGAPTRAMIAGVRAFKGEPFVPEVHADMPIPAVNRIAGRHTVYLLGGATPLYFAPPVLYHTTWDTSPLGRLMREYPGEPWVWSARLRERGVVYVLADLAELTRLGRSGWYDPSVTVPAVLEWLDEVGEQVAHWPNRGQRLYRLKEKP
ncbi:MAG: hypothetical protein DYG94_08245 [Leptolyngbya sp. PLA3]|nr:MAG: hypothetical protein EDM82_09315 [Cyanobacteria bacterium CYA]MCE7968722.1 hypothetical protein [Leptolyngbya sp. PL-A3]